MNQTQHGACPGEGEGGRGKGSRGQAKRQTSKQIIAELRHKRQGTSKYGVLGEPFEELVELVLMLWPCARHACGGWEHAEMQKHT